MPAPDRQGLLPSPADASPLAIEGQAMLPGLSGPYPGLRPFESAEEPIFCGRQTHTDELLRRLAEHRFLAIVGTSGSGKSSLVKAGLLPALERGFLAGATSRWRVAVVRPGMAPIENMADALRGCEAHQASLPGADAAKLRSSSLGLVGIVRDARLQAGESLLVVADQFEEIFRYQRTMSKLDGGADAARFVKLLLTAAQRPDAPVFVVLTMRSDFLGDCAEFPGLPEALTESQYLIPRLTREHRRRAIEEPLRLFGASMTPRLVEQLLNDSGEELGEPMPGTRYRGGAPDTLPVLQHALMRTYLDWKSLPHDKLTTQIDLPQYQQVGRMDAALDNHAEYLYTKVLDDEGRRWAERVFRCVTTTELGRPVRRPTHLENLYRIVGAAEGQRSAVNKLLTLFRQQGNSFLQLNRDTTVDISHESLIWKWKRLSGWVVDESASAELYCDLAKDAGSKATWGEPKLTAALSMRSRDAWNADWARQYSDAPFDRIESFLARSKAKARNLIWLRWFGAAAAVLAVIFATIAYYSMQRATLIQAVKDGLVNDLGRSEQRQQTILNQIAELSRSKGTSNEHQASIEKEKADLQAQLTKVQQDSEKLNSQLQQSNDLLGTINLLKGQLAATQKDRDDEVKKRQDAETRLTQLTADAQNSSVSSGPDMPNTKATGQATPGNGAAASQLSVKLMSESSTPAAESAGSKDASARSSLPLSGSLPNPCPGLIKFRLAESEMVDVTLSGFNYYIFLTRVVEPGVNATAEVYIVATEKLYWHTKRVRVKEFVIAIKALERVPGPVIANETYGLFDLGAASKKLIQTPSGRRLWITVKPSFVLSHADFKICPE